MDEIKAVMSGENPFKQWGYHPVEKVHRKVGERWTDKQGRSWEQKNGYRVIVNAQADGIREMLKQTCSKCGLDMKWGNRLDTKFFRKSGMCYDCTIDHDTILRAEGDWATYEKRKVLSSQLSYIKDARSYVEESIRYLEQSDGKITFVNEIGEPETWSGVQIETLLQGARGDYEKLTKDIEETESLLRSLPEVTMPESVKV
jgi:hypothetical protein